ncbi:hypothetical protein HDU98_004941, partial [Podochytrium sp. JEL0797]
RASRVLEIRCCPVGSSRAGRSLKPAVKRSRHATARDPRTTDVGLARFPSVRKSYVGVGSTPSMHCQ